MAPKNKKHYSLLTFGIELVIYAGFVLGYFLLVLRFLNPWLAQLHEAHRNWYAVTCLVLIVAQGGLLEAISAALLTFIQSKLDR